MGQFYYEWKGWVFEIDRKESNLSKHSRGKNINKSKQVDELILFGVSYHTKDCDKQQKVKLH